MRKAPKRVTLTNQLPPRLTMLDILNAPQPHHSQWDLLSSSHTPTANLLLRRQNLHWHTGISHASSSTFLSFFPKNVTKRIISKCYVLKALVLCSCTPVTAGILLIPRKVINLWPSYFTIFFLIKELVIALFISNNTNPISRKLGKLFINMLTNYTFWLFGNRLIHVHYAWIQDSAAQQSMGISCLIFFCMMLHRWSFGDKSGQRGSQ